MKKSMIVGFDAKRVLRNGTGLGSYGRTLVNSLPAAEGGMELLLYAPDEGRDDLRRQVQLRPGVRIVCPEGLRFRLQRDWWRSHGIVKQLKSDGVSLFHGLSGELPYGLRAAGIPGIVTIHDLIFLRHPEYYNWIDVQIYKRKFLHTLREADRIIAISECTKRDILHYGSFPEDRIDVIYQSCSQRFRQPVSESALREVAARYRLPQRYVLNVGTIEERKNVLLAVRALHQLPQDVHLVVVGRRTSYTDRVQKYIERHALAGRVHILHGVPDAHLYAIYRGAECFVYPSRYEGFGIPVIEAIQSGLPVVACTGSCLEEAGGDSCLYVGPDDVGGMAAAISHSLRGSEGREQRVAAGLAYVARFENSDIAAQVVEEYHKVLSGHR